MIRSRSIAAFFILATTGAFGQREKFPVPEFSAKGQLILPVPVGNDVFNQITETIGQFDLQVQMPLFKGLGIGVGGKASFFSLDERALASQVSGDMTRLTWYGKVQYEQYTSERTFYELAGKVGGSTYQWNASTLEETGTESGLFWGLSATYYLNATENLAFGLLLGYESDAASVGPQTIGLEDFPGQAGTTTESPINYFTIGLCFHTLFKAAPDRPLGTF